MDARDLKRRAGIIVEGVDVNKIAAELAGANKQELASILSKAAATSSDMYGDAVIVQAFQAAIDQLSGGGLYEEETDSASSNEPRPSKIKVNYQYDNDQDEFDFLIAYNAQGEPIKKLKNVIKANEYINTILKTNNKVYLYSGIPDASTFESALKKALEDKGISLEFNV